MLQVTYELLILFISRTKKPPQNQYDKSLYASGLKKKPNLLFFSL